MFTVWKASKLNSDWYLEVTFKKKKKKKITLYCQWKSHKMSWQYSMKQHVIEKETEQPIDYSHGV